MLPLLGPPPGLPAPPAPIVIGYAWAAAVNPAGAAIGAKTAMGVPTAHNGGQIKRYHSGGMAQNEVPAILEEGEFVVRKEAVSSVGLETLNRINQTGNTGSVNISFTGNVLSQDFIEDEAIPMIKEAVRRGADIGVS